MTLTLVARGPRPLTPIGTLVRSSCAGWSLWNVPLSNEEVVCHQVAPHPRRSSWRDCPVFTPVLPGWILVPRRLSLPFRPTGTPQPVRVFRTFTPDLHALVAWFVACGIDTVAMESTGVYWIPIYELLEAQQIVPFLVNARHVKNGPRAQERLERCPVAPEAPCPGLAAGLLSSGCRDLRSARPGALSG